MSDKIKSFLFSALFLLFGYLFLRLFKINIDYLFFIFLLLSGLLFILVSLKKVPDFSSLNKFIARYYLIIGAIIIFLFFLPYIFLGTDSYLYIDDVLDSLFTRLVVIVKSGTAFKSNAIIDQMMNGIPRNSLFYSGFSVVLWLFTIFPSYSAYLINMYMVAFLGFLGIYLILSRYILIKKSDLYIVFSCSLLFAFLPHLFLLGITVAGIPLLFYAYLNIYNKKQKITDYIIIFFFPFYSSLPLTGIFILLILLFAFSLNLFKTKKINKRFLLSIIILGVLYLLVEHNLIYTYFFSNDIVTHRSEFSPTLELGFFETVKRSGYNFFIGHTHVASFHTFIIGVAILILASHFVFDIGSLKSKPLKHLAILLLISVIISVFYGFYQWLAIYPIKERINILLSFEFNRIHWFHPVLWYLIFAVALSIISTIKHLKFLPILIIIFQFFFIINQHVEYKNNLRLIIGKEISEPTYSEYFAEDLFKKIENYIDKPKNNYKIISLGIHPSISHYNGFYTLDGYFNFYSLDYKHRFRTIIEKELDKNEFLKKYFDKWGSKCYLFVDEIGEKSGFLVHKREKKKIYNLEINSEAIKDLGGDFIFSAAEIVNSKKNKIAFRKVFKDENSAWDIYLYEIK